MQSHWFMAPQLTLSPKSRRGLAAPEDQLVYERRGWVILICVNTIQQRTDLTTISHPTLTQVSGQIKELDEVWQNAIRHFFVVLCRKSHLVLPKEPLTSSAETITASMVIHQMITNKYSSDWNLPSLKGSISTQHQNKHLYCRKTDLIWNKIRHPEP